MEIVKTIGIIILKIFLSKNIKILFISKYSCFPRLCQYICYYPARTPSEKINDPQQCLHPEDLETRLNMFYNNLPPPTRIPKTNWKPPSHHIAELSDLGERLLGKYLIG